MLSDCILHQDVKFFFRRFEGVRVGNSKRQTPIGTGGNLAVLPFQPISWREFFDAVHQRPRRGDVVQREIAIEPGEAQAAVNLGVNKQGFQLGREE